MSDPVFIRSDQEHLADLLLALQVEALTIRQVCDRFNVSKATAQAWIGKLATDLNVRIHVESRRDSARGPKSRTYKVIT